jgi:hypothetical protein
VCGSNCDGFCQIAMMYCTAANAAAVYSSAADCQTQCAAFPNTVKFNIGVQEGSSVACLLYHSQEASSAPPDHCLGDIIQDDAGDKSTTCHRGPSRSLQHSPCRRQVSRSAVPARRRAPRTRPRARRTAGTPRCVPRRNTAAICPATCRPFSRPGASTATRCRGSRHPTTRRSTFAPTRT